MAGAQCDARDRRLLQIRQHGKKLAKAMVERYRFLASNQKEQLLAELQTEWERARAEEVHRLEEDARAAVAAIGGAHRAAQEAAVRHEQMCREAEGRRAVLEAATRQRCVAALEKEAAARREVVHERAQRLESLRMAKQAEAERAALVVQRYESGREARAATTAGLEAEEQRRRSRSRQKIDYSTRGVQARGVFKHKGCSKHEGVSMLEGCPSKRGVEALEGCSKHEGVSKQEGCQSKRSVQTQGVLQARGGVHARGVSMQEGCPSKRGAPSTRGCPSTRGVQAQGVLQAGGVSKQEGCLSNKGVEAGQVSKIEGCDGTRGIQARGVSKKPDLTGSKGST
eukprot:jgi/Botrbrau1/5358/Bobra.0346s0029.1